MRPASAALAACLLAATPAPAAVIGTCTIMVGPSGTIANDPAIAVLGSKQPGGAAAGVTVQAFSLLCAVLSLLDCFSVSAPAPAAFLDAPPGGNGDVGFATSYRVDNAPADTPGHVRQALSNGTHAMQIDLTATRTSGIFPAGSYRAQVTVRCE